VDDHVDYDGCADCDCDCDCAVGYDCIDIRQLRMDDDGMMMMMVVVVDR